MSRLNINIGTTANDRTGDPLRTAFEKVNANFIELYARTGDDIQIPALSGNNGKYLKTNGTILSWEDVIPTSIGNFVFTSSDASVPVNSTLTLTAPNNTTLESKLTLSPTTKSSLYAANTLELGVGYGTGSEKYWLLGADGSLRFPDASIQTTAFTGSELFNGGNTVSLESNGTLTLPNSGTISNTNTGTSFTATTSTGISGNTKDFAVGGDVDTVTTSWTATGGGIVGTAAITNVTVGLSFTFVTFDQTFTATGPITFISSGGNSSLVITPDGATAWTLDSDGILTFPNGATQQSTGSINCQPEVDTVVFTSSSQGIQTIKLLFKVEGTVTTGDADTQSCEMIVAKGFRGPTVAASVYGIVYTSVAPLATFTAQWNATTSRVEVLCRPTSLDNSIEVKAVVTEITTSD
jgi:hypothetical protein